MTDEELLRAVFPREVIRLAREIARANRKVRKTISVKFERTGYTYGRAKIGGKIGGEAHLR